MSSAYHTQICGFYWPKSSPYVIYPGPIYLSRDGESFTIWSENENGARQRDNRKNFYSAMIRKKKFYSATQKKEFLFDLFLNTKTEGDYQITLLT